MGSSTEQRHLSPEVVVEALYEGLLGRPADEGGLEAYVGALLAGRSLIHIIQDILESAEFQACDAREAAQSLVPTIELPDLTRLYPEKYSLREAGGAIFWAHTDDDFRLIEALINKHRYYDSFGVWSPAIDLDKRVTAAIVEGLGARSCIELGCFSGPVLSVLADKGIEVCGVDVSHLAFVLAIPNIHEKLRFGPLLEQNFEHQFDVFLGMDILEHLNPLDLDAHISRIAELVRPDGFAYINSPMFGADDTFGTVFEQYLPEWRDGGDDQCWRHLHCDLKGWPAHGHLVWASPQWWERAFLKRGLVRDRRIERELHGLLSGFFDRDAPARRSFFVLHHAAHEPDVPSVCSRLRQTIGAVLS
jgi:hypothetical protein